MLYFRCIHHSVFATVGVVNAWLVQYFSAYLSYMAASVALVRKCELVMAEGHHQASLFQARCMNLHLYSVFYFFLCLDHSWVICDDCIFHLEFAINVLTYYLLIVLAQRLPAENVVTILTSDGNQILEFTVYLEYSEVLHINVSWYWLWQNDNVEWPGTFQLVLEVIPSLWDLEVETNGKNQGPVQDASLHGSTILHGHVLFRRTHMIFTWPEHSRDPRLSLHRSER